MVALLIFAMLVSSCMDLVEEISNNDTEDNYQVTPGRGIVKFIISDGKARTILPNASIDDMYFRVTFFDKDASPGPDQVFPNVALGQANSAKKLNALGEFSCKVLDGTYDVSIQAYNSSTASSANLITAWGTGSDDYQSSGYTVDSGNTTISAALEGKMTTKGIFKYAVTIPSAPTGGINTTTGFTGYSAQTLDVYDITDLTTPVITQQNLATLADNTSTTGISIDSGVYKVKITLKAGNCEDRVLTNVMHIWDGLTSTYKETNLPAPNQNKFTVKFDVNNDDSSDTISDVGNITSGSTISAPTSPTDLTGDYVFDEWWTTEDATGRPWDFTNDKVYRDDITLYAHWTGAAGIDMDITITFDDSIGDEHAEFEETTAVVMSVDGTNPVTSITYDQLANVSGSAYMTITLTSDLADSTNHGTWTVNGGSSFGGVDIPSASITWISGKAVLTINKSNVATILGGGAASDYVIEVEIDDGAGGLPYSAKITINVTRQ